MTGVEPQLALAASALLGVGVSGAVFSFYARHHQREFISKLADISSEREIVTDYINRWVAAVSHGSTRAELLQMLLKTVERSTDATASCIFERQEDDTLLATAAHGLFPPLRAIKNFTTRAGLVDHLLKRESYKMGDGLIGAVGSDREGILIERPQTDARVYRHDDMALRLQSLIVVPISFQDTLFGVLALANPRGNHAKKQFSRHDLQLTIALAEQAALALHNSDLVSLRLRQSRFDFDLSVASSIQTMLLPSTFPKSSRLDISSCYHPAQKVGGDLYDVFELSEGQIGVAIADVSGKGVPASLLMAITQSHLRHLARMHHSPARVLSEINKILQPEIRQDMFVTVVYAVIDPEGHSIVYARAGHELPILAGNGRTDFLLSDGIAIGMAPQSIFDGSMEEKRVGFAKGDRLILYTDGLTEAINSIGEEFSSRRIAQLAQQNTADGAQELNDRILKAVENFSGRCEQEDDVTLLTIGHL